MAIYTLLETIEKFPRHRRVIPTSSVSMPKNVASHACKSVTLAAWSLRHTWWFLILRNRNRRSRWIWSPAIFATNRCRLRRRGTSTLFPGSIEGHFEKSCDKIAPPDWFTLLAIRSNERTGALGEFNRWYLTCQISAISYADRGDRWKIANAAPGTPGDFRRSRRSMYKIARCVLIYRWRNCWRSNSPRSAHLVAAN